MNKLSLLSTAAVVALMTAAPAFAQVTEPATIDEIVSANFETGTVIAALTTIIGGIMLVGVFLWGFRKVKRVIGA